MNLPRNRKDERGNPPPTAGASDFYPNHRIHRGSSELSGYPIHKEKNNHYDVTNKGFSKEKEPALRLQHCHHAYQRKNKDYQHADSSPDFEAHADIVPHRTCDDWRNISITLKTPEKGEEKSAKL